MRAIGVLQYGGPEALEIIELPKPEPSPGEIRMRVHAAAINPADRLWRNGALADWFGSTEPPHVPGMDAAGVVDVLGDDVDAALGLEPGRPVVAIVDSFGPRGAYSDYLVVPVDSVVPAPSGSGHAQAASFLMPALTAREALDQLKLPPRASLLVSGAAGGVGQQAVALAHAEDLRVLALASSSDDALLRSLGADEVIDRGGCVEHAVLDVAPDGVDGLIDTADLHGQVEPQVRDGGGMIVLSAWDDDPGRGISLVHIDVRNRDRDRAAILELRDLAAEGLLPMTVASSYPASEVVAAHRHFDRGGIRGRIILHFAG